MKHITNCENEESLKALHRAQKQSMDWGDFSCGPDGHMLRLNKAREQNGMCGYCECMLTNEDITEFKKEKHLDHFYPRNKGAEAKPQLQYDWDNLILSCFRDDCCGRYKDGDNHNILPSQIINPRHEDPRDYITFVIEENRKYVSAVPRENLGADKRRRAQDTIDALNLNYKPLRVARMNAIWSEYQVIETCQEICATEDDIVAIRHFLNEYEKVIENKEFASTLLSYAYSKWGDIN